MKGTETGLQEMLLCRERRAKIQDGFLQKYHCPVISFCMNIPGPIKTNPDIRAAFYAGKKEWMDYLKKEKILISDSIEFLENTGDELIMAVHHPAKLLKKAAVQIEETHPFGRLFDIDVIDTAGRKLSRTGYRKCILCGCRAQECARMRRHSVKEMQDRVGEILRCYRSQANR